LEVGGLISPTEEHVSWVRKRPLHVGDKITVRVVEKKAVDEPTIKYHFDPTKDLKNRKIYVRKMAKKLEPLYLPFAQMQQAGGFAYT
jgi:hypothetical protein